VNREIIETKSSLLKDLVRIIGYDDALALLNRLGGQRVYIRKEIEGDHIIAQTIGSDSANKLALIYGGDSMEIPVAKALTKAKTWADIRSRHNEGATLEQLVEEFGFYKRKIRHILAN